MTAPSGTPAAPAGAPAAAPDGQDARPGAAEQEERAFCVRCSEPTEHPASTPGATLCPVCEWQEAERVACSCT
ncbi:hypothetical protein GCM10010420_48160 [Streptomyces glaucosporus]|uniref:Small CPxCG-related zinc finger protein n=1 Tax=Streptomyces glaucosporus TaxID=284044 RepID=A0ABN3ISR1_9ACTN